MTARQILSAKLNCQITDSSGQSVDGVILSRLDSGGYLVWGLNNSAPKQDPKIECDENPFDSRVLRCFIRRQPQADGVWLPDYPVLSTAVVSRMESPGSAPRESLILSYNSEYLNNPDAVSAGSYSWVTLQINMQLCSFNQ